MLQRVARALTKGMRSNDIVACHGGEEFALVTPGRGKATARVMAGRLVDSFRAIRYPVGGGGEANVTVPFGHAVPGEGGKFSSVEEMFEAGDKALYVAKNSDRNRHVVYSQRPGWQGGYNSVSAPAAQERTGRVVTGRK